MNGECIRCLIVLLFYLISANKVYTEDISQENEQSISTTNSTLLNSSLADNGTNEANISTTEFTNSINATSITFLYNDSLSVNQPHFNESNPDDPFESHLAKSPIYFAFMSVLFAVVIMVVVLGVGYAIYSKYEAVVPYAMCHIIRPRNAGNDLAGLI